MSNAIVNTNFMFHGQKSLYQGKVRDVYNINNEYLIMIATDRISAFDIVLPKGIPYKGQVLNQIASKFLDATSDIVPNWKLSCPDPMVTIGQKADPIKVEMVIRGYLTGHAWREYKLGNRVLCGIRLPEGMRENEKFPYPIITPTTKAVEGHDQDITNEEIINLGLVSKTDYSLIEKYTYELFERGTQIASKMGLILVDTKYEFGKIGDKIILIDEIHTPDSSRYFYAEGYKSRLEKGEPQKQLSKEFVRQWLIEHDFMNMENQIMPDIPESFVSEVSERYIELYEKITGEKFLRADSDNTLCRIENNIVKYMENNVQI